MLFSVFTVYMCFLLTISNGDQGEELSECYFAEPCSTSFHAVSDFYEDMQNHFSANYAVYS